MRSRMLALVAGLLFLGSVVGVAVVSRSTGGDLPKLPFGSATAERSGASMAAAADMALYRPVTYKLADGLERPTDKATAYRLVVGPSQAEKVAKALGVTGDAKAVDGRWTVTEGSRVLRLDGPGSWYLSDDPCQGLRSDGGSTGAIELGTEPGTEPGGAADDPASEKPAPDAPVSSTECVSSSGVVSSGGGEPGSDPGSSGGGSSSGSTGTAESRAAESGTSEPAPPPVVVCDMPECPPGSACTQACPSPDPMPEPVRPTDLPSKSEARAQAVSILEAMGFDAERGGLRIEDGFTAWSAMYEPYIDGVRAVDLGVSINIGSKGRIEWASGWVADFEKVGDYPLATLATAIKRLNVGFVDGPRPMAGDLGSTPAVGAEQSSSGPATTDAVAGSEGSAPRSFPDDTASQISKPVPPECGGPTGDCVQTAPAPCNDTPELTADCAYPEPACDPVPAPVPPAPGSEPSILIEPAPAPLPPVAGTERSIIVEPGGCTPWTPPEPEIVTLTSVTMGLSLAPVFDGQSPAYMVPAFVFSAANTSDVSVVAVIDDLLAKPDPADGEPATNDGDHPAPADGGTPVTLIAPVPKD